jgi:hypothetical protein
MTQLVTLRLAYWRAIITDTPCPEPLCGAKEGQGCAGDWEPFVHQRRLRLAVCARNIAESAGLPAGCGSIVEEQDEPIDGAASSTERR